MTSIFCEKLPFALHVLVAAVLLNLLTPAEPRNIQLVGPTRCSGRVEIFHRNSWGTVCDDRWSVANAEVVCREMDCGTVHDSKKASTFGEGKNEIWLDDVECAGNESSLLECRHPDIGVNNCGHGEDVGVICSDSLRLVNGSNRCNGKVEVYHSGRWKPACNAHWSREETAVVCREINCGLPLVQNVPPDSGETPHRNTFKTKCQGNETSIGQCTIEDSDESCTAAAVLCTNSKPIRLMNGTHRCSGRVEVYHNGEWGSICDDRWGMPEAVVTCREMNCGNALSVKYRSYYGQGNDRVWMDDVECTGHEKALGDCPHRGFGEHDCNHNEDAGVECSENIRLVKGPNGCSGRLEVFHNGVWGKVCNSNWGQREANIICKELLCGSAKSNQDSFNYGDSDITGFTSRCSSDATDIRQCGLEEHSGRCQGVSVTCGDIPPLRLVNGTDRCSGRVEYLHDGAWGTVCDDDWDIRDAQVVCRAMDCGTALTAKSGAFFGPGNGDIWMDDVRCLGNESTLVHCQRNTFGDNNCGHSEDAGVICSADIRLVNGTDQCSGRVEYHHGESWYSPFNIDWGHNEEAVVCREMNCGDPVQLTESFGEIGARRGYKISCRGSESSLTQCEMREYDRPSHVSEVSIKCSGDVKLTDGPNRCTGRVEFYDNGRWGTVCSESWDILDATVACQQIDCGKAHKITSLVEYGQGSGHTWQNQIECNGRESTLSQCTQVPYHQRTCNATSVAGVFCTGSLEVRLANGKDDCSGRVEVRHGETWQTVCDTDWTISKADVICDMLECGRAFSAPGSAHFGQGVGSVVEANNACFGNATFMKGCSTNGFSPSKCTHAHDAGAVCAAQIRLAGGSSECSGRVEIFYKGQWGTVCDDEWEMADGDVVCRQLGCGHAVSAPHSAHFGQGTGPIWLDNVECSGQETVLAQCSHPQFGENNCGHSEDASVICLGALEKPQIHVSPGPEVSWGERVEITCTVKSEHSGGTFSLKTIQGYNREKFSEHEVATFLFPSVNFDQRGSYFCEYEKKLPSGVINYPQGNTLDLSVTVKLETPSISLTSPHAMVVYSPDKVSVTRGNTFSVTCSTHSRYPGGSFHLTKSNVSVKELKPKFGHMTFYMANFEFPSIDTKDQGLYTCVYAVNISATSFCSAPSKTLEITVSSMSTASSATTGVVVVILLLLVLVAVGFFVWRRRFRGSSVMVQFSNRFGGAIKQDTDDRVNGTYDLRDRNNPMYDRAFSDTPEDKTADEAGDPDNAAEADAEDLAGRVCYELEPLVFS
ncbi:unnamed protein product [Ophioblennius macclurei]